MIVNQREYTKNIFFYLLSVVGAIFLMGFVMGGGRFDFNAGYFVVSFIALLYLGTVIAGKFETGHRLDKKAKELGLTPKEFRDKYKDVLDIKKIKHNV